MAEIIELAESLANQIAAGEVVERPASVIKELLENAIDASATQIDIFVEEAGLKSMKVVDNGKGIAKEDVENAFKRHATSKIHHKEDLFRIRTLGFRGEALPSIASVSKVMMETATIDSLEGTKVTLMGGEIIETMASPQKVGTTIEVKDLFYNTPARLKYVKSLQTELANIGDVINRLALSHPNIAFRFVHDDNIMMKTTGNGDLKQAIAGIYGLQTAKKMVAIAGKDLDFKVSGYVSLPEVTRASRNYISIIINGRFIKNYVLNKAIIAGYASKLMVGRFPICVLQIEMDPLLVDVNVHPTKQEVRLSKEKELTALIQKTIFQRLKQEQLIPDPIQQLDFKEKNKSLQSSQQLAFSFQQAPVENKTKDQGFFTTYPHPEEKLRFNEKTGDFYVNEEKKPRNTQNPVDNVDNSGDNYPPSVNNTQSLSTENVDNFGEENAHRDFLAGDNLDGKAFLKIQQALKEEPKTKERFPQLEYFGQMHGTFLFAQSKEGLYIIDQHAAQERIKYEYYRVEIGKVTNEQQDLLFPLVLEYPLNDYLKIKEKLTILAGIGLELEDFGKGTFLIRRHPTWMKAGEEEKTIRGLIEMLLIEGKVSIAEYRSATAIMMSCKRSIKANHYLDEKQARQLLVDLAKCENPFNCPHGRPVLIHFSNTDLEKMFKRIQDPH